MAGRLETVTVMFTDVVGSTPWRVRVGGRLADEQSAELERAMRETVSALNGFVVKSLGDGVMATFTSAVDALEAAVSVQVTARHLAIAGSGPGLRIGLSSGDMVREGDDWLGRAAIEAARLCAEAGAGTILVADATALLARGRTSRQLTRLGSRPLRGFDEPIDVFGLVVDAPVPPLSEAIVLAEKVEMAGRSAEVALADRLLAEVAAGACRAMLIAGEPGVGKTRLAASIATAARQRGFVVLYGRCDDGLSAPYQPIIEAFEPWILGEPDAVVRRVVGNGVLGALWPRAASSSPRNSEFETVDADTLRWHLLEDFVSLARTVATDRPMLLVIDDLHWAEASTLLVLRHLLRRSVSRCALVLTSRPVAGARPVASLLGELGTGVQLGEVELVGLADAEIRELIARHVGAVPPRAVVELLRRATDGNPFLLNTLLDHLDSVNTMRTADGRWLTPAELDAAGVPAAARDVITRRLRAVADVDPGVLDVAAVIGLTFDEQLLRGVLAIDDGVSIDALDAAIDARLVREVGVGQFGFVHALVRQAVLDHQTQTARARWHWRVGQQLERNAPERVDEIARHYAAGFDVGVPIVVVSASLAAARSALASAAFEEAAEHAHTARVALERMSPDGSVADLERRFSVLSTLGQCMNASADLDGASAVWLEAAAAARQLGDAERLFASVEGFASPVQTDGSRVVAMLDEVLALVGPADSPLHARALGWRAVPAPLHDTLRAPQGDPSMVQAAVAMARRTGDHDAILTTLRSRLLLESYSPDAQAMFSDASEVVALGPPSSGGVYDSSTVLRDLAIAMIRLGRTSEALATLRRADSETDRNRLRMSNVTARLQQTGWLTATGRFADASRFVEELRRTGTEPLLHMVCGGESLAILLEQGHVDDVIASLRAFHGTGPDLPAWEAMLANCLADVGRRLEADALLSRISDSEPFGYRLDTTCPLSIRHLSEACLHLRDARRASRLLPHVARWAGQLLFVNFVCTIEGASDRCLAHLLATLGRFEEADTLYARAEAIERSAGFAPLLARTDYWHARCLIERGSAGDRARAGTILDEAIAIADRLGMRRLAALARADLGMPATTGCVEPSSRRSGSA